MREYRPKFIILLEPHINGGMDDMIFQTLGKKCWARSEAFGFNGGLWVLQDEEEVDMKLMVARRSFLHMEIRFGDGES